MQDTTEALRPKAAGGRKRIALVGAAILSLAVLGACAGGNASERPSADAPAELSKGAFIAQADKICADYESEFMSVKFPKGDPTAPDAPRAALKQFATANSAIAAIERDMIGELRALTLPENLEEVKNQSLDLLLVRADHLDVVAEAAVAGDLKTLAKAGAAANKAGTRANQLVGDWGFKVCGVHG